MNALSAIKKTTSSKVTTVTFPEFLPGANVLEVVLWMPNKLQLSQRRKLLSRNPYLNQENATLTPTKIQGALSKNLNCEKN